MPNACLNMSEMLSLLDSASIQEVVGTQSEGISAKTAQRDDADRGSAERGSVEGGSANGLKRYRVRR